MAGCRSHDGSLLMQWEHRIGSLTIQQAMLPTRLNCKAGSGLGGKSLKKQYLALTVLVFVLVSLSVLLIIRHLEKSPATVASSNAAAAKLNARAETIKALELRVAQADPNAQLALAKLLLDGTETPPNYKRARALLVSASKQLPEATVGLVVLQRKEWLRDNTLPDADTLKTQALATQDAFAIEFLLGDVLYGDQNPPPPITNLANGGSPLANAKLAYFYSEMAERAANCKAMADSAKKLKSLGLAVAADIMPKCSPIPRVPNSRQLAINHALAALNGRDVGAEKIRYWTLLFRRLRDSHPSVSGAHLGTLLEMQFEHVAPKRDPYSEDIAEGLSSVGGMIKNEGDSGSDYDIGLAVKFLTRAAELGDDGAQKNMGELYKTGAGTLKDFDMAARYFAQSAQQGNADAMKNLGLAFIRGDGVEQDKVQAYFWLSLCTLGDMDAHIGLADQFGLADQAKMSRRTGGAVVWDDIRLSSGRVRDELAQTMSAQQLTEAQGLARAWLPSYQVGPPPTLASINAGTIGAASNASDRTSKKSIPMHQEGGGYVVPVLIDNSITLNFVVDSGASDVSVPSDVVSTLMRTGTLTPSDFLDAKTYVLADGSKMPSRTFRIKSLKVGDIVVENVVGSIAPAQGALLLGQSFLSHFKTWSIDNTNHALVVE
jgi:TPR repeat protein